MDADPSLYEGPERRAAQHFLRVGELEIPYVSRALAVAAIDRSLEGAGQIRVAFCNANTMLKAMTSAEYARAFKSFLVLNDGVGVDICSRLFTGKRFAENLNGTDFTPALLRESRHVFKIFLLGGAPGVAETAAVRFEDAHPRHKVVGVHHGFFTDAEAGDVVAAINASQADLVLVALGNPRQEQFVAANAPAIGAPVILMVGALFDFVAGRVVRAPRLVRAARAEWVFRLMQEPRRLGRRYTIDVASFLARLVWMRASRRGLPPTVQRRLRPEN